MKLTLSLQQQTLSISFKNPLCGWINPNSSNSFGRVEAFTYSLSMLQKIGAKPSTYPCLDTKYSQLAVDKDGAPIDKSSSPNYKYFTKGEIVSDGKIQQVNKLPLIHNYKGNVLHLATHPVIYMNGACLRYDEPVESLQRMVKETYRQLNSLEARLLFLSQSEGRPSAASFNLELFQYYLNTPTLSEHDLIRSISSLSRILSETYNRDVVVLFDENDFFVRDAFFSGRKYDPKTMHYESDIFDDFMYETFKHNEYMDRGIITGILPVLEALETSIDVAERFYILEGTKNMFQFYGILEHEFDELCIARKVNQTVKEEGKVQYGGYYVLKHSDVSIFNARSVKQFINRLELGVDDYWIESNLTNVLSNLFKQIDFQREMAPVIRELNGTARALVRYHKMGMFRISHFEILHDLINNEDNHAYDDYKHDAIVHFLFVSLGLLSVDPSHPVFLDTLGRIDSDNLIKLKVPNKEMQSLLQKQLTN